MENLICYTLDLEPDFGGRLKSYSSLDYMPDFYALIKKNGIKLTTFAAGHMLKKNASVIKGLVDIGSEIEMHSYTHNLNGQDEEMEIRKCKEAYKEYFGRNPLGYRSPQGKITKKGIRALSKEGFKYDSSLYPAFFPGRYSNLSIPAEPFYYDEFGLVELPLSVIPKIRLPLSMSYVQPIGYRTIKSLISIFGLPHIIVFNFHMWNLYKPIDTKKLPFKWRFLLARNLSKGLDIFGNLAKQFKSKGYKPITMQELYQIMKAKMEDNQLAIYKA